MAVISRYEVDKTLEILQNDIDFQQIVVKTGGIKSLDLDHPVSNLQDTLNVYREMIELLLKNREVISKYSVLEIRQANFEVDEFVNLDDETISASSFREALTEILNESFLSANVFRQILYSFKYSTIKTFFRQNWKNFVPDYDVLNIEKSEQLIVFQEAFMREFDKFSEIIDEIYNLQDVDRTPNRYLNYLAQTVGYEREDEDFLFDASFRELIKNIIEVYRIKGTNFSFELFFNFLGFEATVREFWFDARYFDPLITGNPFTGVSSRSNFSFYLTTIRPTEYIPNGMRDPVSVNDDEIGPTLDGSEFNSMVSTGKYTPGQLLGLEPGYPDEPYRYFKTNIMEFTLERVSRAVTDEGNDEEVVEEEEGTEEGEEGGLTTEELQIIRLYANFLTPIFLARNIVVITKPFESDLRNVLTLSDGTGIDVDPKIDPRADALRNRYRTEYLFHNYIGAQPKEYYWDDGTRFYKDPLSSFTPGDFRETHFGRSIKPGGNFISGYYYDTYNKIYDPNNPSSAYYKIKDEDATLTTEEIYKKISDNITTKEYSITVDTTQDSDELLVISGNVSDIKEGHKIKQLILGSELKGNFVSESNEIVITSGEISKIKKGFLISNTFFKTSLGETIQAIEASIVTNVNASTSTITVSNGALASRNNVDFFPYYFLINEARVLDVNESTNTITIDKTIGISYDGADLTIAKNLFLENWIFERDLHYPVIDKETGFINPFITENARSFFGNSVNRGFFNSTKPKTYYSNPDKFSYFQDPETFPSLYNRGKIKEIVADNGSGNGEVYVLDTAGRFSNMKDFGRINFVENLFGYLEKGTKKIRNVEYDKDFAPEYSIGTSYVVGDYIRFTADEDVDNYSVDVFRCIKNHTADDISPATTEGTNWVRERGVWNLKKRMKIKLPNSLFEFEIVRVNSDRSVEVNEELPKTENEVSLTFYDRGHNFVTLKGTLDYNNEGVYNIIKTEPAAIDGYRCTKLTTRTPLKSNQTSKGGFLSLYLRQKRVGERNPFMYNTLDMIWKQKGFSMTSELFNADKLILNPGEYTNLVPYIIKTSGDLVEGSNEIVLTTNNLIEIKPGYRLIKMLGVIDEETYITDIDYETNTITLDKNILKSENNKEFRIRAYKNGEPLNKGITYYMTAPNQFFSNNDYSDWPKNGDRHEVYHRGFPYTTVLEEFVIPDDLLSFFENRETDPLAEYVGYENTFYRNAVSTGNSMYMQKIYLIDEFEEIVEPGVELLNGQTIRNSEKIYNAFRNENFVDYIDIKWELKV